MLRTAVIGLIALSATSGVSAANTWVTTDASDCSDLCGNALGHGTVGTVTCADEAGAEVADAECTADRPRPNECPATANCECSWGEMYHMEKCEGECTTAFLDSLTLTTTCQRCVTLEGGKEGCWPETGCTLADDYGGMSVSCSACVDSGFGGEGANHGGRCTRATCNLQDSEKIKMCATPEGSASPDVRVCLDDNDVDIDANLSASCGTCLTEALDWHMSWQFDISMCYPPMATCATVGCGNVDPNRTCACDEFCTKYGDCCPDYVSHCHTCEGRCGDYKGDRNCECDADCSKESNDDCCADYEPVCNSCNPLLAGESSQLGACNEKAPSGGCWCDAACVENGDCCADLTGEGSEQCQDISCVARGGCTYVEGASLQCDSECEAHGDCAVDYQAMCNSCAAEGFEQCGLGYDLHRSCQCDNKCEDNQDCCDDELYHCQYNNWDKPTGCDTPQTNSALLAYMSSGELNCDQFANQRSGMVHATIEERSKYMEMLSCWGADGEPNKFGGEFNISELCPKACGVCATARTGDVQDSLISNFFGFSTSCTELSGRGYCAHPTVAFQCQKSCGEYDECSLFTEEILNFGWTHQQLGFTGECPTQAQRAAAAYAAQQLAAAAAAEEAAAAAAEEAAAAAAEEAAA